MEMLALTEKGMSLVKDTREMNIGSQGSAGRILGVNQVTIHDWETGRYKPNQYKFMCYLKLLKIDPNAFVADRTLCESVLLSHYPNKRKIEERPKQKYKPFNMDYSVFLTKEGRECLKELRIRKFGPQISASAAMNFNQATISHWENGKSLPPLRPFMDYLEILKCPCATFIGNDKYATVLKQTVLEKSRTAASILNRKSISAQRKDLTIEKAYILGTVGPGDGYVGRLTLELSVTDREFSKYFAHCIKKVYGVKCRVIRAKPNEPWHKWKHRVRLTRRNAVEDVRTYARYWQEYDWEIPEKILNGSPEVKAAYLRAFFDSQSHVSVTNKEIVIYVINLNGLKVMKQLLSSIGIESTVSDYTSRLRVYGKDNLTLFSEKVNYVIKRKREALEVILKSYN